LRSLVDVQQIVLSGPQVSDAWLESINSLSNVSALTIIDASITDNGLSHLGAMTGLERLGILYTPITDAAIDPLQRLSGVQFVMLYGTKITREGASRLQTVLAGASVDVKNGAFLGISADPNRGTCVIATVRPGSAAEQAGLLQGDVITHYDGQEVADFKSLQERIGQHRAGDEVKVTIERASESLTVTVRLGQWDYDQLPR
jgi:predicted metalloprotease with PDZ domain